MGFKPLIFFKMMNFTKIVDTDKESWRITLEAKSWCDSNATEIDQQKLVKKAQSEILGLKGFKPLFAILTQTTCKSWQRNLNEIWGLKRD